MTLGVHFALTEEQRRKLYECDSDDARIEVVTDDIEENTPEEDQVCTEKAWDAIHRCLGEFPPNTPWFYPVRPELGKFALPEDHGSYPLKLCVLGGKRLMEDESNYFIRLIEPEGTEDISTALAKIDKPAMRERYFRHCEGAWPEYGEEDFEYTWEYFEELRSFFLRIAGKKKAVIFTASQ